MSYRLQTTIAFLNSDAVPRISIFSGKNDDLVRAPIELPPRRTLFQKLTGGCFSGESYVICPYHQLREAAPSKWFPHRYLNIFILPTALANGVTLVVALVLSPYLGLPLKEYLCVLVSYAILWFLLALLREIIQASRTQFRMIDTTGRVDVYFADVDIFETYLCAAQVYAKGGAAAESPPPAQPPPKLLPPGWDRPRDN